MATETIKKESINTDEVLFDIWCIMNQWDERLVSILSDSMKSINALKTTSTADILKLVDSINWDSCNQNTTKNSFKSQIDKLKKLKAVTINYPVNNMFAGRYQTNKGKTGGHISQQSEDTIYSSSERGAMYNCMRILWCGCLEDSHLITTKYVTINRWDGCSKIAYTISMEDICDVTKKQSSCCCFASCCCACCIHDVGDIVIYGDSITDDGTILKNIAQYSQVHTYITGHLQDILRRQFRQHGRSLGRNLGVTGKCSIAMDQNIGFSVGGAKNINSFRDNILQNHRVPQLNSITFEGIYYDYYFNTDDNEAGDNMDQLQDNEDEKNDLQSDLNLPLFYPSYCYAKSHVPDAMLMAQSNNITKKTNDMIGDEDEDEDEAEYDFHIDQVNNDDNYEYFLTIGLKSNIKSFNFERKKLNLVIILDVSGSMGGRFRNGGNSKMQTANECILSILTHLCHDDRFGLVLFDNCAWTHIPFQKLSEHKLNYLESILNIKALGGTNFEAGYNEGLKMFEQKCDDSNIDQYENRMIFATDACPNAGRTDPDSLMNLVKTAATNKDENKRIYTTFVGVGLDFNADLIAEITKVRGANYFAIHSSAQFFKTLDLEFDYIVSPMVFDLQLSLQIEGNEDNECIESVYGSNDMDIKSGEVMNINTLFPSPPNAEDAIKGGIVLIKLKKLNNYNNLIIQCSFEDKCGRKFKNKQNVILNTDNEDNNEYYANIDVRKGILLTRHVLLMKYWIEKSRSGQYIKVSNEDKQIFKSFIRHFENEMQIIKDDTLKQEVTILSRLIQ